MLLIDWSSNCGGIRTVNHLDINSRWCLLNMHDAHLVLFAVHVADSHDMWSLIKFVCIYTKKSFVLTFVPDFINSLTQQYLDTEMGGGRLATSLGTSWPWVFALQKYTYLLTYLPRTAVTNSFCSYCSYTVAKNSLYSRLRSSRSFLRLSS